MTRHFGLLACAGLIVGAAVVHGTATHRWSAFSPSADRSTAIHKHAVQLGDYTSEDVPSELPVKERSSVTCRRYSSKNLGQTIVVSITSGPPGAVSTHTPDVCYPGSGYRTVREPKKETLSLPNGGTASYWVAEYEKKTATTVERHRIRWAWSADGNWDVPKLPRLAYLRQPELYKIYVVTPVVESEGERAEAENPAIQAFLTQTLDQYSNLLKTP